MTIYFRELLLDVEGDVYKPAEDSFLLAENLKVRDGDRVLDMGTGCGIQALAAAGKAGSVLGVDFNPKAVEVAAANARLNKIHNTEFKASDLFSSVEGRFDLIVFNPPYLPTEGGIVDYALDGGDRGVELILKFIKEAPTYLNPGGRIQFIMSSLNNIKAVETALSTHFRFEYTAEKKLFFEKLLVATAELKH
jgi:release factor glutamine methyltransferase